MLACCAGELLLNAEANIAFAGDPVPEPGSFPIVPGVPGLLLTLTTAMLSLL